MGKILFRTVFVAGITGLLLATRAAALTIDDFTVTSTHDLVKLCSADTDDRYRDPAKGFCLGYLDATWDYHEALTRGEDFDALACPEPTVTRDMALRVFLQWAEANPGMLDGETPVQGVMRAISEKWPCPAN